MRFLLALCPVVLCSLACGSAKSKSGADAQGTAATLDASPDRDAVIVAVDARSGDASRRDSDVDANPNRSADAHVQGRDAPAADAHAFADASPVSDALPRPDVPSAYSLELGGGPAPFRHLANGDTVPWVHGPQGLPMIILAVRARGFATGNPTMPSPDDPLLATSCTNVTNGMEVGAGRQRQGLSMQPDGWAEFYDGWTPFVGAMPLWLGQRLRCTATLSDAAGHTASDVREVVVNVVEGM